ncbi:hypothetical protein PPH41_18340 [Burkholderia gladioli]|nr:hypothetical protein [Burkholderia gladioli]
MKTIKPAGIAEVASARAFIPPLVCWPDILAVGRAATFSNSVWHRRCRLQSSDRLISARRIPHMAMRDTTMKM